MYHILLILLFFLLSASFALTTVLRRFHRSYSYPVLKALFISTWAISLTYLTNFFSIYLRLNLRSFWERNTGGESDSVLFRLWQVGDLVLAFIGTVFFIKAILHFKEKKRIWGETPWITLLSSIFILGFLHVLLPGNPWLVKILFINRSFVVPYSSFPIVILLLDLFAKSKAGGFTVPPEVPRTFALFFLFRESCRFFMTLMRDVLASDGQERELFGLFGDIGYLLLTVFLTFIFVYRYLVPNLNHYLESMSREDNLRQLHDSFPLSSREIDIVRLITKGYSNKEISNELMLSPSTVKNHLYRIYQKLDINSRFELIKKVQKSG